MNAQRTTATLVGALFLTAMVASLVGGGLVESAIAAPYDLAAIAANDALLIAGILLELVNAIAVLAIGVLLFPVLGATSAPMARGYLALRVVEAVFCAAIIIGPMALMSLGGRQVEGGGVDPAVAGALGALAMAARAGIVSLLIPVFFCLGALVLYTAIYRSRLLPRFIAIWGLIAALLILAMNLLSLGVTLDITLALLLALPMILNEIFLGIWLIVKGFNLSAQGDERDKAATTAA